MPYYTLNNLEADFRTFASDHKQINTFGFGDLWEINSSGSVNYPLMWVVLNGATVLKSQTEWDFSILFMDLVDKAENNEIKVLSDMHTVALDLISDFRRNSGNSSLKYPFIFSGDSSMEDFTERFGDEVSGWKLDIKIRTDFGSDACVIPY